MADLSHFLFRKEIGETYSQFITSMLSSNKKLAVSLYSSHIVLCIIFYFLAKNKNLAMFEKKEVTKMQGD